MRKFLVLLIAIILFIGIIGMPVKNVATASESSVEIVSPTENQVVSPWQDLTVKIWIRNSRETSYRWGYSFISSAAITGTIANCQWSYKSPLMWFTIPVSAIQAAYRIYGEDLHLYIYEVDPHGYTIGFYKLLHLKAYPNSFRLKFVEYDTKQKQTRVIQEIGMWDFDQIQKFQINYGRNTDILWGFFKDGTAIADERLSCFLYDKSKCIYWVADVWTVGHDANGKKILFHISSAVFDNTLNNLNDLFSYFEKTVPVVSGQDYYSPNSCWAVSWKYLNWVP